MDDIEIDRRTLLRLAAVSTAAGTAGCSVKLGDFELNAGQNTDTPTPSTPNGSDGTGGTATDSPTPFGYGDQGYGDGGYGGA